MPRVASPLRDALFGMFLQDVRDIEKEHPKCFENRYYRYAFKTNEADAFELVVEPKTLPKALEKEMKLSFDSRLN